MLHEAPSSAWQTPEETVQEPAPQPTEPSVSLEEQVAQAYAEGVNTGSAQAMEAVDRIRADIAARAGAAMARLDDVFGQWKASAEQELTQLTVRMWHELLLGPLPDGTIEHRIRSIVQQVAGRQPQGITGSVDDLDLIREVLADLDLEVEIHSDEGLKRGSMKIRLSDETIDADLEGYLSRLQEPLKAVGQA